ncbi:MAG: PKD domain-containing protein [Elusimicrobiota bacterium]
MRLTIFVTALTLMTAGRAYSLPAGSCPRPSGGIGEWTFDSRSGGTVLDTAGANNGWFFQNVGIAQGLIGDAAQYNGGRFQAGSPYRFARGSDFTIEMWVNADRLPAAWAPLIEGRGTDQYYGYHFSLNWAGGMSFGGRCNNASNRWGVGTPSDVIVPGQWHHVAVSVDWSADEAKTYVDGELAGTGSMAQCNGLTRNSVFWSGALGLWWYDPAYQFHGKLDEIRIYNRALADGEIRDVYECVAGPSNLPPAADAGPDQETLTGLELAFDGGGSEDPDGEIVSYEWDFGDDSIASGASATHAYAEPGTYTVTLTVADDDGAAGEDTAIMTVKTPEGALAELSDAIGAMDLPNKGIKNALRTKIDNALVSLMAGDEADALDKLGAFLNHVRAQRGKKLTEQQADALSVAAQDIMTSINAS